MWLLELGSSRLNISTLMWVVNMAVSTMAAMMSELHIGRSYPLKLMLLSYIDIDHLVSLHFDSDNRFCSSYKKPRLIFTGLLKYIPKLIDKTRSALAFSIRYLSGFISKNFYDISITNNLYSDYFFDINHVIKFSGMRHDDSSILLQILAFLFQIITSFFQLCRPINSFPVSFTKNTTILWTREAVR